MKATALFIALLSFFSFTGRSIAQTPPKPDHIVIVIDENHNYDDIIGSENAPYINQLAEQGALFTNAHGITHPSQPNYIALFSGGIQGVTDDHCLENETPYTTPNLGHQLISNGYSFAGYSETMPSEGFTGCGVGKSDYKDGSPLYARKHNPWVDWQDADTNGVPASVNKTLKSFPDDFNKLPTVSIVIPNEDNDMHNGPDPETIQRGDRWLKDQLKGYVDWAKEHNSLFIFTYDEDDFTPSNKIVTLFVGSMVQQKKVDSYINHNNVLHTIEAMYGLDYIGPEGNEAIQGIWNHTNK